MSEERLALEGGQAVRTRPLPPRRPFGIEDAVEVLDALASQNLFFAIGTKVYRFERQFAELYGVRHAVASTSGTSAIHVALGAINPEPGDEVVTTPISDMGTVAPIILQNCVPVFADLQAGTFNLDPNSVADRITDRTRAIVVVHCWGQPADMDEIVEIARERRIAVIEDCAQAHLTRYRGRLAGTIGQLGAFSLQSSKHLNCGDGGVTITNDDALGERAHLFADKGCDWTEDRKYRLRYAFFAPCYRMTELQGAVLCAQLKKLAWIVRRRQKLGDLLVEKLQGLEGIHPPARPKDREHSYWSFPLRIDEARAGVSPDRFAEAVAAEGIPMGGPWPGKPLYMYESLAQKITLGSSQCPFDHYAADRSFEYGEGLCPTAELIEKQHRTLPILEDYDESDVEDIARAVRKVAAAFRVRER
jgi:dTDP-4-amino-4,6-dideoxygalactose transaminase